MNTILSLRVKFIDKTFPFKQAPFRAKKSTSVQYGSLTANQQERQWIQNLLTTITWLVQFLSLHSSQKFKVLNHKFYAYYCKNIRFKQATCLKIEMNGLMCTLHALFWQTEACNDKAKKQDWKASRCAMMLHKQAETERNQWQPGILFGRGQSLTSSDFKL